MDTCHIKRFCHKKWCKSCGVVLSPLGLEAYEIEGDGLYCHTCCKLLNEQFGFPYKRFSPPKELFLYSLPEEANYEPLIKPICERINGSGWVWTVESCEGHTEKNPSDNWGDENPMIRLVCQDQDMGALLDFLYAAANPPSPVLSSVCVDVFPTKKIIKGWCEVITYMRGAAASTEEKRKCYRRFAELV